MTSTKSKFTTVSILAAVAFLTGTASATTIPAQEGKSYYGGDTCWDETDGGVRNNCTTAKWWVIPVTLNTGGPKIITAYTSSGASCYYWETNSSGVPLASLTGSGIPLPNGTPVSVPASAGSFAKVQCQVNATRWVFGVDVAFP
jgi:hypothetical protein